MKKDFKLLSQMTIVDRLQPKDMDKLADEVALVFLLCAVPESQISIGERRGNEFMMQQIRSIAIGLSNRAQCDGSANNGGRDDGGAFFKLFQKSVFTPKNLQALYRMCDPDIRTGDVRCIALALLSSIGCESCPFWSLQIPGESPSSPPTMFAIKQIVVMAKALTQKKRYCKMLHGQDMCTYGCDICPWAPLGFALANTLKDESSSYPPAKMLEFLHLFPWPSILQDNKAFVGRFPQGVVYYDLNVYANLHRSACQLLVKDPGNAMAKTFLREKLGSCHELLRTALRRIISGDIFAPAAHLAGHGPLDQIFSTVAAFLLRFMQCLVPVPADRETKALVRRARMAMTEPFLDRLSNLNALNPSQRIDIQHMDSILHRMDDWQELHDLQPKERWELFRSEFLQQDEDASSSFRAEKQRRTKSIRKKDKPVSTALHTQYDGAMCCMCFTLEQTLLDESNQKDLLLQCPRCHQAKYCSQECFREHWNKSHKKHCKEAVATNPAGKYGSSKYSKTTKSKS